MRCVRWFRRRRRLLAELVVLDRMVREWQARALLAERRLKQ